MPIPAPFPASSARRIARAVGSLLVLASLTALEARAAGPGQDDAAGQQPAVTSAPLVVPTVLVRGKRVIVRPGEELADAAVLVQAGRVVAVGIGIEPPEDARVLEGEVVMAGIIDAWAAVGLDPASVSDRSATASARAIDSFDPYRHEHLRLDALRAGVTVARVSIGRDGRIGGLSAVVRNAPEFDLERSVLSHEASISAAIGPQGEADVFTRLDEVDRLIAELDKGKRHAESRAKYEKELADWQKAIAEKQAELEKEFKKEDKEHEDEKYKEDNKPKAPKPDPDADVLARVVSGEVPLVVEIDRAQELRALLDKTKAHPGLRLVLAGATDARFFAEELAERGIPVILLPQRRERGGAFDQDEVALASELSEAGVAVLFGSGGLDGQASRDLPLLAALAVGRGLDREVALAGLTTLPARILDLGHRLGSLERGKDADLLVLSGDPLSATTRVLAVVLAGDVVLEQP